MLCEWVEDTYARSRGGLASVGLRAWQTLKGEARIHQTIITHRLLQPNDVMEWAWSFILATPEDEGADKLDARPPTWTDVDEIGWESDRTIRSYHTALSDHHEMCFAQRLCTAVCKMCMVGYSARRLSTWCRSLIENSLPQQKNSRILTNISEIKKKS